MRPSALWYPQTTLPQGWHMTELRLRRPVYRITSSTAFSIVPQLPFPNSACPAYGGEKVGLILVRDEEIQLKYSSFKSTSPSMQPPSRAKVHQYISTYFPWDCQGNIRNFQLRPENDQLSPGKSATLEELHTGPFWA